MQRLFPGVHGRVIELCKPSQKKYNAAVTIAMVSWPEPEPEPEP